MTKGHHGHHHRLSHFIHHILHPHDTDTAPTTHAVNETQLRSQGFNSSTINLLKRVDGRLERLVEETGKVLRQEGLNIKMQVTQGFRTAREQLACYQNGRSKCDGYRRKSNHQSGRAIDYSLYDRNGQYLTGDDAASASQYRKVSDAFKIAAHRLGYDIQWGGDWKKFKDNDHIEVARIQPNRRGPAVT